MKTYVVRNAQGQFHHFRQHNAWVNDFINAATWTRLVNARKAAKRVGGTVWVGYGTADEQQVWP